MPNSDPPANSSSPVSWQYVAQAGLVTTAVVIGAVVTALITDYGVPLYLALGLGAVTARGFWTEMTTPAMSVSYEHAGHEVYRCPVAGCHVEVTDHPSAGPNPALADFAVDHSRH